MPEFPLPKPWRFLLNKFADIETKSDQYQSLLNAYLNRNNRELPLGSVDEWHADQSTKDIEIEYLSGDKAMAKFEIIGSYDGNVFLWADANPSIQNTAAASNTRDAIRSTLPYFADHDKLDLSQRDAQALLALSAELTGAKNTFFPSNGNSVTAFFISDLSVSFSKPAKEHHQGIITRLFGQTEPAHAISPFEFLQSLLADQLVHVTHKPETLIKFEQSLASIYTAYHDEDFQYALKQIATVKHELGKFYIDQEPSGWLLLCEGACHLALNDNAISQQSFDLAFQALEVTHPDLLCLGLARSATDPEQRFSNLAAMLIGDPQGFQSLVTYEESQLVEIALEQIVMSRANILDDPEVILKSALSDRWNQERRAYELSQVGAKYRTDPHTTCVQDEQATRTINLEYRHILLSWFTVPRSPSMGSYSDSPSENPAMLKQLEIIESTDNVTKFRAIFSNDYGSEDVYRYELCKTNMPLCNKILWRIDQIWSVWDDEEIRMH